MASHIEEDLHKDMPEISEVYVHMESRGMGLGEGEDVTAREDGLVRRIKEIADGLAGPGDAITSLSAATATSARSRSTATSTEDISIVKAHDITTRIEVRLTEAIPELDRILVHAEPENR